MLSKEDNELMCRVGPGTPMGDLMRCYWLPLLYSWELEPDGAPKKVRLLGENLIAFRDMPPASLTPEAYRARSCSAVIPTGVNWIEAFADWHAGRTKVPPAEAFKPAPGIEAVG
jgi:hypothetical protein